MKLTVRGKLADTIAFVLSIRKRRGRFARASAEPLPPGRMNLLAESLHPGRQQLLVAEVRDESPTTRTFRLVPDDGADGADGAAGPAFFRAGQYLALEDTVEGTPVSRPFSISSTPEEALTGGFYEITIKKGDQGFFAPWSLECWKPGYPLTASEPSGTFFYEPLRDPPHLVCLAGGSGITPFRSIIRDALANFPETRFTLLYGVTGPEEIIFGEELEELQRNHPGRFSVTVICSHAVADSRGAEWKGERGFISADLIRRLVPDHGEAAFFICGPPAMHTALTRELAELSVEPKRLRRESFGAAPARPGAAPGDTPAATQHYTITVRRQGRGEPLEIPAAGSESVLVALERAGLNPPALCRSGECGWCRSRLIEGQVHASPLKDGIRGADRKFGWFHPCCSSPRSDLVIEIPDNPVRRQR